MKEFTCTVKSDKYLLTATMFRPHYSVKDENTQNILKENVNVIGKTKS